MTTIEALKEQYNSAKTDIETLQTELGSLNDLKQEITWIYEQLKLGVEEIKLRQITDEDDNIIETNQDVVDRWNNRWTKIDEFTTLLEITNQDMVEIMVRSYSQRSSLSSALNQKIQIIIDAKNQEIKEKEILLENTQDALKLALFEAEGIE
jgi:hypothetical protein